MAGRCFPDVFIHHCAVVKLWGNKTQRARQMGVMKGDGFKPGMPDLLCAWSGGMAFIECKREKGGVTSPAQKAVHERLTALGWPVATITSVDDAHAFLRACGAPCVGSLTA